MKVHYATPESNVRGACGAIGWAHAALELVTCIGCLRKLRTMIDEQLAIAEARRVEIAAESIEKGDRWPSEPEEM